MKKLFFLLTIPILIFSCSDKKTIDKLLTPKNLRTQHFRIDPTRDTLIVGLRGGLFKFGQGSFDGSGLIDIELKEAYSPIEIAYAGLTTESNGRLLESGGMIYLNAKRNGNQVNPLKPIDVSIPSNYINKDMQLFKGEEKADGTVNWTDPEPLDTNLNRSPIDTGELLFKTRCASCHNLFTDMTGPALAGVEERVNDRNVLREFIQNPDRTISENIYFQCLKQKFGSMQTAESLTNHEIDLVLDYIKNESGKRPDLVKKINGASELSQSLKLDSIAKDICSLKAPCGFDTIYVDTTDYVLVAGNMMDLHAEATKEDSMDYQYENPDSLEKVQRKGFTDILFTRGRYNFRIKTLGWFNIDAFYEGMKGTSIVDLFVKSDFEPHDQLEIHVFFPSKKLLTVGTYHKSDSLYHFEKYKGQIPLFLDDNAIAFGVASIKEKIYYGIASFKVNKFQVIKLDIKESSREELSRSFRQMNLDGIDLDIITKKRLIIPRNCADSSK